MKTVILAGGYGTRISEESHLKPKPMIEIGTQPILWHIMKLYSWYGFHDFIICCGYKQHVIKDYFANYFLYSSDVTFDYTEGKSTMTVHRDRTEEWKVTLVDTGLDTMTGGRIKRIRPYLTPGEPFFLTYGDGVSDVNIQELLETHKKSGARLTMTCVQADSRFGNLETADDGRVKRFSEKRPENAPWINGGFMVVEPEIIAYIDGDSCVFERGPLETAAAKGELYAYYHHGFWQCMDTMREKEKLEALWKSNTAPWKVWDR